MKSIIISIIIALLLASGLWYFTKNESQNVATLQNKEDSTKFSEENLEGQAINNNPSDQNPEGQTKSMNAILHTSMGDITIKLNPEVTPNTVSNFTKLAESGFYNGTKFHRVIKDFMNQGGDPLSKDDSQMALWGTGGPGYQFADEITGSNNNGVGSIAMANAGPNTNGSQFFINVVDNSFLNTKHTVFGQVTEGMDVVMAINNVKTASGDRPVEPVVIKSISIK